MDMKNIILDVDGTLWNTTDIVADSWTRALFGIGEVRIRKWI